MIRSWKSPNNICASGVCMLAVFGVGVYMNVYSQNIDDTMLGRVLGIRSTGKEKDNWLANPRYRRGWKATENSIWKVKNKKKESDYWDEDVYPLLKGKKTDFS